MIPAQRANEQRPPELPAAQNEKGSRGCLPSKLKRQPRLPFRIDIVPDYFLAP
jgi:hypothetical protein